MMIMNMAMTMVKVVDEEDDDDGEGGGDDDDDDGGSDEVGTAMQVDQVENSELVTAGRQQGDCSN